MDDLRSRLRRHRIASALQHHLTHCKNALIRTFRRLSRRPSAPSSGLNSSPLRVLPLEMILLIASFLPKACAASFSVSCRQLQLDMGPAYLRAARRDKVARGELLASIYLRRTQTTSTVLAASIFISWTKSTYGSGQMRIDSLVQRRACRKMLPTRYTTKSTQISAGWHLI